jgi:hypothetical protein
LGGAAQDVVDKMPMNYLYLGLIATLRLNVPVVACRRDPRNVTLWCWTTFGEGRWANDSRLARLRSK